MLPEKNQLRTWNDRDGMFLVLDVIDDRVVIANGKYKEYACLADVIQKSKVSDVVKLGELRHWSISSSQSDGHAFIVVCIRSDVRGGIVCDILDAGKLYVISLGSLLLVSELLNR